MLYARNMPPKNMTSVMRKIHMPSVEASLCCAAVSNCSRRASVCSSLCNFGLHGGVIVRLVRHDGDLVEIMRGRRRRRLPLQTGRAPWIGSGDRPVFQGPGEIDGGYQIPDSQHRGAGAREHVQHLELRRVSGIAARHSQVAKDEWREKRKIEAEKRDPGRELCPSVGIHA